MIKIVIFDSGYGGEFFADWLEEELPVMDIVRVIDWRHADAILSKPKEARKAATNALSPYIGKVDLIVFANHLLTATSLRYFQRKYKNQKFVGFELTKPDRFIKRNVLVLATKALAKTIAYRTYLFQLKTKSRTLCLDTWPELIDDGDLTEDMVKVALNKFLTQENFQPEELVLACSQFHDIKPILIKIFGKNTRIYDSYNATFRQICKTLRLRGGQKKYKYKTRV